MIKKITFEAVILNHQVKLQDSNKNSGMNTCQQIIKKVNIISLSKSINNYFHDVCRAAIESYYYRVIIVSYKKIGNQCEF